MRRALLTAVAGAALALLPAAPASAWNCFGTQNTVGACVHVQPGTVYEDCVYLGGTTCQPVSVPGASVSCGGWIFNAQWICT